MHMEKLFCSSGEHSSPGYVSYGVIMVHASYDLKFAQTYRSTLHISIIYLRNAVARGHDEMQHLPQQMHRIPCGSDMPRCHCSFLDTKWAL